jgi:hypothetical protein
MLHKLDAIANYKGFTPDDEDPAHHIHQHIPQGDGDTCTQETQIGGKGIKCYKPDSAHHHYSHDHNQITNGFFSAEQSLGILDITLCDPGKEPFEKP